MRDCVFCNTLCSVQGTVNSNISTSDLNPLALTFIFNGEGNPDRENFILNENVANNNTEHIMCISGSHVNDTTSDLSSFSESKNTILRIPLLDFSTPEINSKVLNIPNELSLLLDHLSETFIPQFGTVGSRDLGSFSESNNTILRIPLFDFSTPEINSSVLNTENEPGSLLEAKSTVLSGLDLTENNKESTRSIDESPHSAGSDESFPECLNLDTPTPSVNCSDDQIISDPKSILSKLREKNADRPVIGQLNINFIAQKFEPLVSLIKDNIDLLMVSETKVDDSYPIEQFKIEGYAKPIRLDRNCHGGGFMIFPRDDLPCHELKPQGLPADIECTFLELRIRQSKWLIVAGYNPHKEKISYFLKNVGRELDNKYLSKYENLLLIGDWNSAVTEKEMKDFCEIYNLENLIKEPTCFKSANNPSSIDIMLTNKKLSFQNSMTLETGLSDFHKMTITVLKRYFKKKPPITITYRDLKFFDPSKFRKDIRNQLEQIGELDIDDFKHVFTNTWNVHAPVKKKIVRANNAPLS